MSRYQREKGKRGEREVAALIREQWGIDARRGRQYRGTDDSPDVVAPIAGVAVEVKFRQQGSPAAWLQEAADAAPQQIPLVFHRRTRAEWIVSVRAVDVPRLVAALREAGC